MFQFVINVGLGDNFSISVIIIISITSVILLGKDQNLAFKHFKLKEQMFVVALLFIIARPRTIGI